MSVFNLFMSLFNFKRRARQMFRFTRYRRSNRGWLFLTLVGLGIGAFFSVTAGRNTNMMKPIQKFFQDMQNRASTFMPPRLNAAMMEFAEELTPDKPKKYSSKA